MRRLSEFPVAGLVSLMVILTLGPLGLLAYSAVTLAGDAVTNEVRARARSTADVSALLVADRFEGLAELVDSYADRPNLMEAIQNDDGDSRKTIRSHLRNLRQRKGVATAFLATPSGILIDILPETPSIIGRDFSYRDWYRGVIGTRRPYVSEVYRTAAGDSPLVVAVASPVKVHDSTSGRAEMIGILVAAYDLDALQGFTEDLAVQQQTELTVTDQRGVIIAGSDMDPMGIVSIREKEGVAEALAGRSGVVELGGGRDGVLSAYTPVTEIGFTVIADIPSRVAFAGVRSMRSTVLAVASVLVLVLIAGLLLLVLSLRGRRTVQAALAGSEVRTRAIIEAARDAYVAMGEDGRIVGWNLQSEKLFGWPASEAIGRMVADTIVDPGLREAHEHGLSHFLRTGEGPVLNQRVEVSAVNRDGEVFPVELAIWPTEIEGTYTFHAFVTDVTERKKDRDAMQAAQREAEEANRSKSEFLSRMSHELRTPMNGILGFAQLLEMESGLDPEQRESVKEIIHAGKHLLDLINEVLDISRIEAGSISVSIESVSVREAVRECAALIGPLVDERGLTLTIEANPQDLYAQADHQRLKQLLLNLLSNATKYNRPNGRITIGHGVTAEGSIELRVSDTGVGIPPEKIERLFIPFDRLDVADEQEEGTGLGLALSKKLVDVMNGTLSVESEKGVGTTFSVVLPMAGSPLEGARLPAEPADGSPPSHGPAVEMGPEGTVLYIEDNVANVTLVETIFKRRPNVTLQAVMTGQLGIDLARELLPDLVLLDMNLPDMSGADVLVRLQADPVTEAIPVVMLSADVTEAQITRMFEAGVTEYLTKPLDVAEFLSTLDGVLSRRTAGGNEGDPG